MPPRDELTQAVLAADAQTVEGLRGAVRQEDVPELTAWYWTLDSWTQKQSLVDLIQDQHHSSMDEVMLDVLRAPGELHDWVALPKIVALGYLSEEHDQFMAYYNDRALLGRAVVAFLAERGLEVEAGSPESKPAPKQAQDSGEPPLLEAIMEGQVERALELLSEGANPNAARLDSTQSALWWAATGGSTHLVEELLRQGADLESTDRWGSTPLHQAASGGHLAAVRCLLAAGADPNRVYYDGRHLLKLSLRGGKPEIVAALLDAGADPGGVTLLDAVGSEGSAKIAKLLIERGFDLDVSDARGRTPLMEAASMGRTSVVQDLLAAGADPAARDKKGQVAADLARGKRAARIRELLGA